MAPHPKQKQKDEGRCSSAPAKFTVIGKFLVAGEVTEGRGKEGQDGRGGKGGKAPVTHFTYLLYLSYEFLSISNGERIQGTGKSRWRGLL